MAGDFFLLRGGKEVQSKKGDSLHREEGKEGGKEAFNCGWEKGAGGCTKRGGDQEGSPSLLISGGGDVQGEVTEARERGIRGAEKEREAEGWRGAAERLKSLSKKFFKKTE